MRVCFYDAEGEITATQDFDDDALSADIDAEMQDLDVGWVIDDPDDGEATPQTHYVDLTGTPTITERPKLDDFTVAELGYVVGTDGTLSFDVPDGTVIDYNDGEDTQTVVGGADPFTFETDRAGDFAFSISPPFPYQLETLTIIAR